MHGSFSMSGNLWCMLFQVGVEDWKTFFFSCKFINGQTHCGIPRSAKMSLASNEPTVLQVKLRLTLLQLM